MGARDGGAGAGHIDGETAGQVGGALIWGVRLIRHIGAEIEKLYQPE